MLRRLRAALLAVAPAALVLAAPALASPADDAKIQATSFDASFNNDSAGTVYCPPGAVITGGGFGVADSPPLNIGINVSAPTDSSGLPGRTHTGDSGRRWYASAYSGTGHDVQMKAFAICSKSSNARLRVKSFSVPDGKTRSAVVSCPRGQAALGGGLGLASAPVTGVYEADSGPLAKRGGVGNVSTGDVPRRWEVAAYNGYSVPRTFQAIVACSGQLKPHVVAGKVDVSPSEEVEYSVPCPVGKRVLGGGVLTLGKPTDQLQINENGPLGPGGTFDSTDDGQPAFYWDADVYNRTSKTRFFKTLAVCA